MRSLFALQIAHLLGGLRSAAALLAATAALILPAHPARAAQSAPPRLPLAAACVLDVSTGRFVYEYRADTRRPMASTTKIMTGKVVLDSGIDLQRRVRVGGVHLRWDESNAGLKEGQTLSVDQLLQALLVPSGNDAARVLAVTVAGSEAAFVARMNASAKRLGLLDTHYSNSHGMDAPAHFTTARDLTRLALAAVQDPRFASYVRRTSILLPDSDGARRSRRIQTTDTFMLRHPTWVSGVKTGHTNGAGFCLVSMGKYGGQTMIVTAMGAPDVAARDAAVMRLYRYARSRYVAWRSRPAGTVVRRVAIPYARAALDLSLGRRFAVVVPPGARVSERVASPAVAALPVSAGRVLGKVTYAVDGTRRGERPLVAAQDIPGPEWQTRLRYRVWSAWQRPAALGERLAGGWRRAKEAARSAGEWLSGLF